LGPKTKVVGWGSNGKKGVGVEEGNFGNGGLKKVAVEPGGP